MPEESAGAAGNDKGLAQKDGEDRDDSREQAVPAEGGERGREGDVAADTGRAPSAMAEKEGAEGNLAPAAPKDLSEQAVPAEDGGENVAPGSGRASAMGETSTQGANGLSCQSLP